VRQSSNFAVFVEDTRIANFYGGGGNSLWFRTDQNAEKNGGAPYGGPFASPNSFQAVSHAVGPHHRKAGGLIAGTPYAAVFSITNIAFADGSARSVKTEITRFPARIPEIWVRPEHPNYTW
jgi:prepilin-type processing-associated H-X9-DG protein